VFAGWYMAILVWVGGVFFVFAWTLAWIIAAQTFFSPHSAFAVTGATVRMRIAACVHAAAFALAGALAPDGADDGACQSVAGALFGLPAELQAELLPAAFLALLVGIAAFVWVLAEWVAALVIRHRRSRAAAR